MGATAEKDCESTKTLENPIDYVCRLEEGLWDKHISLRSEVKSLLASLAALRLSFTLCASFEHESPLVKT